MWAGPQVNSLKLGPNQLKKLRLPPAHSRRGRQSSPPDSLRRPAPGWRESLPPSRCRRPLQTTQRCGRRQGRCQLHERHRRCTRNTGWERDELVIYLYLPLHRGVSRGEVRFLAALCAMLVVGSEYSQETPRGILVVVSEGKQQGLPTKATAD